VGAGPRRRVGVVTWLAPWAALTTLAVLLAGSTSISQTLWAKVLTISGSAHIAPNTPTATDVPTAEVLQGCSPGFWKQEQHFAEWPDPFMPEGSLEDALAEELNEGNPSLLEGLQDGGGGLTALVRQAIAALLNAAHEDLDYAYAPDEVLSLFEAAVTTGSYDSVKDMFEAANEAECPLPTVDLGSEAMPVLAQETIAPTGSGTVVPSPTAEPATETPTDTPVPVEPTVTPEPPTPTAEPATPTMDPPPGTAEPPEPTAAPEASPVSDE
jgi:hypothetical protein